MIGKISGRIDYVATDHVLIEAAGVGYIVHCAAPTLAALPGPGEPAALYTELVVREDLMQLYGFRTVTEREWHRLLTSVQGVGAKVSLAILGALGPDGVGRALALGDAAAVKAAPGVGPKLAARIVNELKDKAPAVMALGGIGRRQERPGPGPARVAADAGASPEADPGSDGQAMAEAMSALVNLGYERGEAAAAIAEVSREELETAELIRAALRRLAPA